MAALFYIQNFQVTRLDLFRNTNQIPDYFFFSRAVNDFKIYQSEKALRPLEESTVQMVSAAEGSLAGMLIGQLNILIFV